MPKNHFPAPRMVLEPSHARRFLLVHQRLLPPRRLEGADGVMDLFRHLGCIQFDPIDIVGRNPDLVLQSRVGGYRPSLLEALMYGERRLYVGWDKMAAIVQSADWPSFARHRALRVKQHGQPETPEMKLAPFVLDEIRKRGPLSSRDIEHDATVDWWWGRKKRLVGASLEILSAMGIILVHHRVRSIRYFDLTERLLPPEVLKASDPYPADEDYQEWHVLRRIGSLGLAPATGAPEYWWGIMGVKGTAARAAVLSRLAERGEALPVGVEGVPKRLFFIRATDLPTLEAAGESCDRAGDASPAKAAFIAPLDNLIWDRELLRQVFDFDDCWKIYKPKETRAYGYYVLPVLYGDRFVARVEPVFDKKAKILRIEGWWWEKGVRPDSAMKEALGACVHEFAAYLGAARVELGERARAVRGLKTALGVRSRPGQSASG
jgi:uncharacterized protein